MSRYFTTVIASFEFEGFHRWEGAQHTEKRQYLTNTHRHIFWVQIELQVFHDDREVEIHDLRDLGFDFIRSTYPDGQLGKCSCEMIGRQVADHILATLSKADRWIKVTVLEDKENGACVQTPFSRPCIKA